MARKRNKKHSRQSCGISEFQMLEPRLFLSTTVMYRQGGTGSYTDTPFDDCELDYASDTVSNSWYAGITAKSGAQQYGLMAVKNLFTLLPATDANGSALSISSAQLILTRYNTGSSSDTIYVDRMTSNWLNDAAGSSDADTTWKHRDKSAGLFWAGGGSISTSDYITTNEGSHAFVNNQYDMCTIDITALVKDIYSTSTNDGVIIRTSSTTAGDNYYTSEVGATYAPILSITYDYIPKVTITATDASAAEPNNTGTYTVTRTGTGSALTVSYTVTGTATNGTDYTSLTGTVTIPSGQASATITLTPTNDNIVESTETAILTLAAGTGYTVGTPNAATVNIADNDSTVSITATQPNAAEPSTNGTFTVTRAGYTGAAVTVNYTATGTATNGTDYTSLTGSVTIASGQTTATITVAVIDDAAVEGTETAILTLTSGTDYTVGSPNNATVNITDNDTGSISITGVSGIVNASQPITISGNSFGTGSVTSLLWDDFDTGTAGAPLNANPEVGTWSPDYRAGIPAQYSTANPHSGSQSCYATRTTANAWNNFTVHFSPTNQIYQSFWFYYDVPTGYTGEIKLIEVKGSYGETHDGSYAPAIYVAGVGANWWSSMISTESTPNGIDQQNFYGALPTPDTWHRVELFGQQSSGGGATDGYVKVVVDGVTEYEQVNCITRDSSAYNWSYNEFIDGFTNITGNSYTYIDDAYLNNSWNRVELGNASTWAACTDKEIQPISSWSNSSIGVNLNFGSLNPNNPVYLYVVKADGTTVSAGYQLTVSQAPLANNDTYTVTSNNVLTASAPGVLANDKDLQGGTITATKMSNPSHGSVTFNSNGSFTYTPNSNYYGPDSFTYQDSDGTHTGNTGTVNISVRQLMVDFNGGGVNVFGSVWTPQWQTVVKGGYVYSSTDGPGGLIGGSTGSGAWASIGGSAQTFSVGQTVYVTWYNDTATAATFTPQISFTDPDGDGTGTSGTWYNLTPTTVIVGAYQSVTVSYPIDAGSAGSHSLINVCRFSNNLDHMMLDKIELG